MDQDFVFIVQFWLAYSVSSIVNEWNLLFLIPENLLLSFIYTWIVCRGGERERGEKKIFVSCVKQTDEQRDPQRGCVMFGQPLLCVCSVFAWNSHDHQTPGYNTWRITLNSSHILTSELRTLHFSDIGKFIQVP